MTEIIIIYSVAILTCLVSIITVIVLWKRLQRISKETHILRNGLKKRKKRCEELEEVLYQYSIVAPMEVPTMKVETDAVAKFYQCVAKNKVLKEKGKKIVDNLNRAKSAV